MTQDQKMRVVAAVILAEVNKQLDNTKVTENCDMLSSAVICKEDAEYLINKGDFNNAVGRGLSALRYLVGISGNAYQDVIDQIKVL